MNKEEFKKTHQKYFKTATDMLLQDGFHNPLFIIHCRDCCTVITPDFETYENKKASATVVSQIAALNKAQAIFMISESWVVISDDSELSCSASEHPAKIDCLMVTGESHENSGCLMMGEIIRDEKGEITSIIDLEYSDDEVGGIFSNLLNAEVKEKNKALLKHVIDLTKNTAAGKKYSKVYH